MERQLHGKPVPEGAEIGFRQGPEHVDVETIGFDAAEIVVTPVLQSGSVSSAGLKP